MLFRSRQQSLRATALLKRPTAGANITRRPGLAHLHGEKRWRWPLRRPVKSMRSLYGTYVYNSHNLTRVRPAVLQRRTTAGIDGTVFCDLALGGSEWLVPRHAERRVACEGPGATPEQPGTKIFLNFKRNYQASTDQAWTARASRRRLEVMFCISFDTPGHRATAPAPGRSVHAWQGSVPGPDQGLHDLAHASGIRQIQRRLKTAASGLCALQEEQNSPCSF